MTEYAFLVLPAVNSVYTKASLSLSLAELAVFDEQALGGRLRLVRERRIGGLAYVGFECDALAPSDVRLLSNLSSLYALFEVRGDALLPVELAPLDRFGNDLVSIQKYSGKTNELFTKLLLNVTLLSTAFAAEFVERKWRVFDPLCGRGTTLNQALLYGCDAAGVELDPADFKAYSHFIRTWLENHRLKHEVHSGRARRRDGAWAERLHVSFAASKDDFKSRALQQLSLINADTEQASDFFGPGTFDVIVTDAPYGVQHGSRARGALSREPGELLRAALPGWIGLLREGGAIGISWNTRVLARARLEALLVEHGLAIMSSAPWAAFEHRVAQAITRDLVVARK